MVKQKKAQAFVWIVVIIVVLAGAFFFINQQAKEPVPTETTPTTTETTPPSLPEETESITPEPIQQTKEFTIEESSFKLDPNTITVNQGDLVKITVINKGGSHNLFIEGYNQRVDITGTGTTQVMEFTADTKGTFSMWCEFSGHKGLGMEGKFIVE